MCLLEKELLHINFYKDKSRASGFMYTCRSCENNRSRLRNFNNPRPSRYRLFTEEEKLKHYKNGKLYCSTPKGRAIQLASAYRKFDQKRGFENDMTWVHILEVFKSNCFYCGYTPTGFDRILNTKGHTVDNCVPCCKDCNVARMDNFTHEEMIIIGKVMKEIKDARKSKDLPHIQLV